MLTVVEDKAGLTTPAPDQPEKVYPAWGEALIWAFVLYEKFPSPVTFPPLPAERIRGY